MKKVICGGKVWQNGRFIAADVLTEDDKIGAVGTQLAHHGAEVIDASGRYVIPGIIDAHTHGSAGVDVNAAGVEGLRKIAAFFASQGVTAFHASVLTDTDEVTEKCLSDIQTVMRDSGRGAQLMGAHLEGPFLSPEYKGAMPEYLLQKGNTALFRSLQKKFPGVIRYITVSPDVEGVNDMIAEIKDDVVVAIGHSGADYDTGMTAVRNGARCITHTFNAMRLFHHHEPGMMGAALESDTWCEAICDGRHLHPAAVRLLLKCKGWDKVMAVTDSIMAGGLPDGRYKLGVNDVVVINGDARLADRDVRAGSTLTAQQGLRNLVAFTNHPLEDVVPLLTINPAKALRIDNRKGNIKPGLDADLVLLDDQLTVTHTISLGETVFKA